MTRDQLESSMAYIREFSKGWSAYTYAVYLEIKDHDAEQRQRIEELEKGLGCSRSHPHEEMSQVCELKTEIARLKNEMSHWTFVRFKQLGEENATLREALEALLTENEDYIRINNLSAMGNVNLVNARKALKEHP